MSRVNYVLEHIYFIEYASDNGLSSSEQLLWYALIHMANRRAQGGDWPDGFIRIPNDKLMAYLPIGFDAMARARNKLQQRGLIDYRKGRKNADVPMYEIHYMSQSQMDSDVCVSEAAGDGLYPHNTDKTSTDEDCCTVYPQKTDKPADKTADKPADKTADKTSNIYIKLNSNKDNQNKGVRVKQEEEEDGGRAREDQDLCDLDEDAETPSPDESDDQMDNLAKAVQAAYASGYGKKATPEICKRIALSARNAGMSEDMIRLAISEGAKLPAGNIWAYCAQCFQSFADEDILTPDEYSRWRYLIDYSAGKIDGVRHNVDDELETLRYERIRRHRAEHHDE